MTPTEREIIHITIYEDWDKITATSPKNDVIVMTKIHDLNGERNKQPLKRKGNLWLVPDGSMYVYYTPTHWYPLTKDTKVSIKNTEA